MSGLGLEVGCIALHYFIFFGMHSLFSWIGMCTEENEYIYRACLLVGAR